MREDIMKRSAVAAFLAGAAFGQTATAPPAFESADIHISAPSTNLNRRGGALRGGRYDVRNATMLDLIGMAYRLDSSKIVGGPNWLEWDRFDVLAKAPQTTAQEDLNLMLQDLLADRFKLVVHKDMKVRPAYVLSAGKGKLKLKEASETGSPGCRGVPQNQAPGSVTYQVMACRGVTMEMFADVLWNWNGGTYLADPVVDQTALSGTWDFEIKWSPRNRLAQAGADGISLFDAIDKQLGLKLEPQKAPMQVLVVDSVNQKPTPNAPDVASKIPPPPPTEFEVATIKPSAAGAVGQRGNIQNGRVDIQNFTLKQLIQLAWDLNDNDEMIRGLANSADSTRYDVTAKVATAGPVKAQDVDFDALRLMFRGLLIERFRLQAHMEDRPVSAYTMTATKAVNLQKANPENRTNCKSGAGSNPMLNRLITCQNMNMAQFAVILQQMVGGYVHAPIRDATGLDGYYDFSVNFSGINLLPGARFDPNASAGVSDPNGSLSLPEAMQKQLGLKLVLEKRPLPVLVVDHVDEKPTEN
jgi:uncharacterized protein (TIGR03435 family)